MEPPVLKQSGSPPAGERLMSIDALRGFDMFWIVGAEPLVHGLRKLSDSAFVKTIAAQLDHKNWEGVNFEDLIFPLFVFIVGVSIVFSLGKSMEKGGTSAALIRVGRRAALLYLLGIFYYGGFAHMWPGIRLVGVLQRIAICYFFASLIFCVFKVRGIIACLLILLGGYWALMSFVPIPELESKEKKNQKQELSSLELSNPAFARFAERKNLSDYIDSQYLPGKRWDGDHDPEGLLSTLPAIGTCLLGVLAGLILKGVTLSNGRKAAILIVGGAGLIGLGYLWGLQFPIIKKIWTSSYVLVAGGYGSIMLGTFFYIIDELKYRAWAMPFVWIGSNAITIYMLDNVFSFGKLADRFVGGDIAARLGSASTLVSALVALALTLALMNFMYRRKIFIRL